VTRRETVPPSSSTVTLETDRARRSTVLISFATPDLADAESVRSELQKYGVTGWVSVHDIDPGTPDWDAAIRAAISESRAVLLIGTPNAARSKYVKAELALGEARGVPIIPLWIRGESWVECAPLSYAMAQHLDCRGRGFHAGVARSVALVGEGRSGSAQQSPYFTRSGHRFTVSRRGIAAGLVALGASLAAAVATQYTRNTERSPAGALDTAPPPAESTSAVPSGAHTRELESRLPPDKDRDPVDSGAPALEVASPSMPDPSLLSKQLRRHNSAILSCFQTQADGVPPRLDLIFNVAATGKPRSVDLTPAELRDSSLGKCLLRIAREVRFPGVGREVSFSIPVSASVNR
jgi:hypothetical protein